MGEIGLDAYLGQVTDNGLGVRTVTIDEEVEGETIRVTGFSQQFLGFFGLVIVFGYLVITSYSIHYTKLYEGLVGDSKPLSYEIEGLPTGFDRAFIDRLCDILRIPVDYRIRNNFV